MSDPNPTLLPAGDFRDLPKDVLGLIGKNLTSGELTTWRACSQYFRDAKPLEKLKREQLQIVAISAGGLHSVFLRGDGSVLASGDNEYGQLGAGPQIKESDSVLITGPWGDSKVNNIIAGFRATYLLLDDGRVFATGLNQIGQFGTAHPQTFHTPTQIVGPWGTAKVKGISTGDSHTFFQLEDGLVFATGRNTYGQLGLGHALDQFTPVPALMPWGDTKIKILSAGSDHTLVLLEDGRVFAAGYNLSGQLGLGHTINQHNFVLVPGTWGKIKVKSISAGQAHTLFLLEDGRVFATGSNYHGELGLGRHDYQLSPVQVTGPWGDSKIKEVIAGSVHSHFLLEDGRVFATGRNFLKPLGLGQQFNTINPSSPVQVLGSWGDAKVDKVISNQYHTFFILEDQRIFATGHNVDGRLGLGRQIKQHTPPQYVPPNHISFNALHEILSRYYKRRGFWRRYCPFVRPETTTVSDLLKLLHSVPSDGNMARADITRILTARDKRTSRTRHTAIHSAVGFFSGKTTETHLSKKLSATDHVISELRNAFR